MNLRNHSKHYVLKALANIASYELDVILVISTLFLGYLDTFQTSSTKYLSHYEPLVPIS